MRQISFVIIILVSCAAASMAQVQPIVVRNVNVITMTAPVDVIKNATVVVEGATIVSINGVDPKDAVEIDGTGKWLVPGLVDMHVHILTDGHFNNRYPTHAAAIFTSTQDIMTPFIANGVTTVLDLNARAGHFGQRNEILRGDVIGPRMALAAMINGGEHDGRVANTPDDGRQSVRMAKAEGYEYIKVYSQLDTATYFAIVDEAALMGMKVIGHIPNSFRGSLADAFVPSFGLVAHAEEFAKQSDNFNVNDIPSFAHLAKQNGTWLCPTLIAIESVADQARSLDSVRSLPGLPYVHPLLHSKWLTANRNYQGGRPEQISRLERMIVFNNALVKAFVDSGVPIVAGTDAGSSGVVWGFSLADELELLVNAGLAPYQALASATCLPAQWLGLDSLIGTVEEGKFADLLLLDANPLEDISNVRRISGVFVNGRWVSAADIQRMLQDLAARNDAMKDKYRWSDRDKY